MTKEKINDKEYQEWCSEFEHEISEIELDLMYKEYIKSHPEVELEN